MASPAEVSRDSAMQPLPCLFKGATREAFSNSQRVVAPPVTAASVSECARSVRPEQLGLLRSTLSERQQPVPAGSSRWPFFAPESSIPRSLRDSDGLNLCQRAPSWERMFPPSRK
ncbi:uncharacterized protein GJ701_017624 [Geothlypis trichas]